MTENHMTFDADADVQAVAEFMQANIAASKLVSVATAIGRLAPILWGHFDAETVLPLTLKSEAPISPDGPHTQ